jgi:hypothetical protein
MLAVHVASAAEPAAALKILDGKPKAIIVNGYSTSFQWPRVLQRKLDRYFNGQSPVKVESAVASGSPIAKWMDVTSGQPLAPWSRELKPRLDAAGERPTIVLCQQSLQWAYGKDRTQGIPGPDDVERIRQGADVLEKYVRHLQQDGADLVIVAMHIYKHDMEPSIGNERLALAEALQRKIPNFESSPDVWTPSKEVFPWGFARDQHHPGDSLVEIMAQCWFETLLKHDGLEVPGWSREEMQAAIDSHMQRQSRRQQP